VRLSPSNAKSRGAAVRGAAGWGGAPVPSEELWLGEPRVSSVLLHVCWSRRSYSGVGRGRDVLGEVRCVDGVFAGLLLRSCLVAAGFLPAALAAQRGRGQ